MMTFSMRKTLFCLVICLEISENSCVSQLPNSLIIRLLVRDHVCYEQFVGFLFCKSIHITTRVFQGKSSFSVTNISGKNMAI